MLDIHCHILPGVDDGSPDIESSVAMAEALYGAGFRQIAASPHYGEGSAGDVPIELATEKRKELQGALDDAGVEMKILPNAEHHLRPSLFDRMDSGAVVPIGGAGRWLLVEFPWQSIPKPEEILFRVQMKGYRVILAHPERYQYVEPPLVERLVSRGILLQLELGSFADLYGRRARKRALRYADGGMCHVLASDLHRPQGATQWLGDAMKVVRKRYGDHGMAQALDVNPNLLLQDADPGDVVAISKR